MIEPKRHNHVSDKFISMPRRHTTKLYEETEVKFQVSNSIIDGGEWSEMSKEEAQWAIRRAIKKSRFFLERSMLTVAELRVL